MRIKKRHARLLGVSIIAAVSLGLLLALFGGVSEAGAVSDVACDAASDAALCTRPIMCWGSGIEEEFGCWMIQIYMRDPENCELCDEPTPAGYGARPSGFSEVAGKGPNPCEINYGCVGIPKATAIWLADVCEPNDGFSDDGAMTWDSDAGGPLEFAASMEGPWYPVEVNGPPWVVTEEMMESFAEMVGVDDWHAMWVRANGCYPRHVGNTVSERDAHMGRLCAE